MLLAAEVVPISLVVTTVEDQEYWQIQYLRRYTSTKFFCILGLDDIDTFPIEIIEVTNQKIIFRKTHASEINLENHNLEKSQKLSNSETSPSFNIHDEKLISNNIENITAKKINSNSGKLQGRIEEVIKDIYKRVQELRLCELSDQMNWQQKISAYEETLTEYYKLLTISDLENSDPDVEKLQQILQMAEEDEILSLLLNEVDNVIVEKPSFNTDNTEFYNQNQNYQKWAETFKIHVDSCDQLNSEVSRLMTKISSLLEQLQDFRSSEAFDSSLESPQSINTKVQSLELLMKEAEAEKERRKLRECLKISEYLKNLLTPLVLFRGGSEN